MCTREAVASCTPDDRIEENPVGLTARDLFSRKENNLKLTWWAGNESCKKTFTRLPYTYSNLGLVGYFNPTRQNQAQILGTAEIELLLEAEPAVMEDILHRLFKGKSAAVFVCDDLKPPEIFKRYSEEYDLPVICSPLAGDHLIDQLLQFLSETLAENTILHGVFLEIIGVGVLITGQSGLGKSELALDLVSRGNRLIADDAPEFTRSTQNEIYGTCPALLKNFLEVRGLGILNIRKMYGAKAIKPDQKLELIIKLLNPSQGTSEGEDRSKLMERKIEVLGISIPFIPLAVVPGRNLAVLVEAAVRDHLLIKQGYIASKDLSKKQKKLMQ